MFSEVGYEAATTHGIAERAGTAVGSLYQFFPDKRALFKALEQRHIERVHIAWAQLDALPLEKLGFEGFMQQLLATYAGIFADATSRVVFVLFYTSRQIFQSIDEGFTADAVRFTAKLLTRRNPRLVAEEAHLLAEVCVHAGNALVLRALQSDEDHGTRLFAQIPELLGAYLRPHVGEACGADQVMKVMKCPRCGSERLSRNGHRHDRQRLLCKDCSRQFLLPVGQSA
ncbi:TetR family transcriptional regulatory protein [Gloeobacter violaceus PCC 7421]|uniref:TetR family transcriptional regulatory protein n=1 Tax=Gloeobacter violaceus (strain ATCC 29082 / PCC 7421) TaxID=251221 RepID=Q7NH53_GLOVI|nr:TetR family transcriptional regulatory protein [Gloeobacter violaceus PCC 7421]